LLLKNIAIINTYLVSRELYLVENQLVGYLVI